MNAHLRIRDLLFGCWHRRLSFPRTVRTGRARPVAARQTGTYVVCLNCGKEFPYDWEEMRVLDFDEQPARIRRPVEVSTHS